MVKDAHGTEIKIGDVIKHIYGPFPEKFAEERCADPQNPRWLSDGFAGKRTVERLFTTSIEVNRIDSKIPLYLGCYCEVLHESAQDPIEEPQP